MNQSQLIDALAEETGESKAAVTRTLRALRSIVHDQLRQGEEVTLTGIGTVRTTWRGPSVIRQVHNGRKMRVGGRYLATIRPAAGLKRAAGERASQHWRDPSHQAAWKKAEVLVADVVLYHKGELPVLPEEASDTAVRELCAAAFGDSWERVKATYERDVEPEVRALQDYLADAARERCQG